MLLLAVSLIKMVSLIKYNNAPLILKSKVGSSY